MQLSGRNDNINKNLPRGKAAGGCGLPVVTQSERSRVRVRDTAGRWRMTDEAAEPLRGNTAAAGWLV